MSTNNVNSCLALYDWVGEIDTVQFHEWALKFFAANGVLPDICGISKVDGKDSNRSYKRLEKRLRAEPLSSVDGLELCHMLPGHFDLVFGCDVSASLIDVGGKMMTFCCDQTIRGIELNFFEPLLERIGTTVALQYGSGYLRLRESGPSAYASGMAAGMGYSTEELAEADRIATWFYERPGKKRHLMGLLRDVYPLNVISEPHLEQRVEGLPLADWIRQSPSRGTLRSLPRGAWLWRIDEANIESVRASLADAGLLIAYLPQ
jgi:hypothetical protein